MVMNSLQSRVVSMEFMKKLENFNNETSKFLILSTGGTIEKTYDEGDGSLTNRESSIKKRIIDELRYPYKEFVINVVMQKDSLDLTEADRLQIYDFIRSFEKMKLPTVVLHGTDTMHKTINFCQEKLKTDEALTIPVVFTGAMRPLGFEDNDARQNVIEAVKCADLLGPGFYLSFHGEVFLPNKFQKNKVKRTFEKIKG